MCVRTCRVFITRFVRHRVAVITAGRVADRDRNTSRRIKWWAKFGGCFSDTVDVRFGWSWRSCCVMVVAPSLRDWCATSYITYTLPIMINLMIRWCVRARNARTVISVNEMPHYTATRRYRRKSRQSDNPNTNEINQPTNPIFVCTGILLLFESLGPRAPTQSHRYIGTHKSPTKHQYAAVCRLSFGIRLVWPSCFL